MASNVNRKMQTYPINLILKNKKCLIVGGGKVAFRKLEKLAKIQSNIVLVAPKINKAIEDLTQKYENITVFKEDYSDKFLDGTFLAFLTSDDRALNKKIMSKCKECNILTCAVDDNWPNNDFITPASFVKDDINIAISSQGKACRRTRMIRESLSRHIDMLSGGELIILGTDHNFLNIDMREPLHLVGDKLLKVADMLLHIWGIHEFMILNTCNRIDLIAIIHNTEGVMNAIKMMFGFNKLSNNDYYLKIGQDAVKQLAFTAAGLMSQTPGEKHITAQVKDAINFAKENNWAGAMLQQWIDSTLHLAKHIRHDTEPLFHHVEIEQLTVKYIKNECKLDNLIVLIIGTGEIGRSLLDNLIKENIKIIWCYHKNYPKISEKHKDKVEVINLNEIRNYLTESDIVISATSANQPILHTGHAPFLDTFKDILMVDLAIPRNISPEISSVMSNVKIIDLDDLKHWHRRENCNMSEVYGISSKIVEEHKDMYDKIIYALQGENKSSH